jgi:hypothetical protein
MSISYTVVDYKLSDLQLDINQSYDIIYNWGGLNNIYSRVTYLGIEERTGYHTFNTKYGHMHFSGHVYNVFITKADKTKKVSDLVMRKIYELELRGNNLGIRLATDNMNYMLSKSEGYVKRLPVGMKHIIKLLKRKYPEDMI